MLNIPAIREDETLESWLDRIAEANGFMNSRKFYDSYMLHSNRTNVERHRPHLLFKTFGVNNWAEFYLEHSYYPFTALFIDPLKQANILDADFCKDVSTHDSTFPLTNNVCPICQQEYKYIRRSHNLPGVKVCWKHNVPLLDEEGIPLCDEVIQDDINYANYAHNLLIGNYQYNKEDLFGHFKTFGGFEGGVKTLMEKYPAYDFPVKEPLTIKNIDDYEVLYQSNNLCEIIHKKCGTKFCMSTYGLNLNMDCPICRGDDDYELKRRVESREGFKLIKINSKFKIVVQHTVCGRIYTTDKNTFLRGTMCDCQHKNSKMAAREKILEGLKDYPEFEFISFESSPSRVTLRHKDCNSTFTVLTKEWAKKNPFCRCCDPTNRNARRKAFKDKSKEMVESLGFTFIDWTTKNSEAFVTVKCKNGHEFTKNQTRFKKNPICPVCEKGQKSVPIIDEALLQPISLAEGEITC